MIPLQRLSYSCSFALCFFPPRSFTIRGPGYIFHMCPVRNNARRCYSHRSCLDALDACHYVRCRVLLYTLQGTYPEAPFCFHLGLFLASYTCMVLLVALAAARSCRYFSSVCLTSACCIHFCVLVVAPLPRSSVFTPECSWALCVFHHVR